ncbi:MAG TPA: hypothetical protein VG055_13485 [Planctomycetaceae bacterium]|nr:hypothetical protein [Planctomycetaceae bacterium]
MEPELGAVNAILMKQPDTVRGNVPDVCGNRVGRGVVLSDSIAPQWYDLHRMGEPHPRLFSPSPRFQIATVAFLGNSTYRRRNRRQRHGFCGDVCQGTFHALSRRGWQHLPLKDRACPFGKIETNRSYQSIASDLCPDVAQKRIQPGTPTCRK